MSNTEYTAVQVSDVENLVDALISAPKNKLTLMTVMAETFISGMRAQERLTSSVDRSVKPEKVTKRGN